MTRGLWANIAHTTGARVYSLAVQVAVLALTARWLGPEGRGTFVVATTWVGLFTTFSYLSLGEVALHRATERRSTDWLGPTLGSLMTLDATLTAAGWLTFGLLWVVSGGVLFDARPLSLMVIAFLQLPFAIWDHYASALLIAVGRLDAYNRAQIVGQTIAALLVLVLVAGLETGVGGALVAILAGQIGLAWLSIRVLVRLSGRTLTTTASVVLDLLFGGLRLHPNAIGGFLTTGVSLLILNHYLGAESVGHYQLASSLVQGMTVLPLAASQVLYSNVSVLGPDAAWPGHKHVLVRLVWLTTVLGVVAALLAPYAIPLIAGPQFTSAVRLFRLLLPTLLGMTLAFVMAPQWIGRGRFLLTSSLTVAVGLLSVFAHLLLVPRFGLNGAVAAALLISGASVVGNTSMAIWVDRRTGSRASS